MEGASHEEGEGNGDQEEGKQVQLHSALGMGIVTRERVGEKCIAVEGEVSQEEREVRWSEYTTPNTTKAPSPSSKTPKVRYFV